MSTSLKRTAVLFTILITCACVPALADTMYATTNDGRSLVNINTTNQTSTVIGNFNYAATYGLAFAPNGTVYSWAGSSQLATLNLSTAQLTPVSGNSSGFFGYALDFDNSGTLWAANNSGFYNVNTATGVATNVAGNPTGVWWMDIAFDGSGNVYGVGGYLYKLNLSTGNATLLSAIDGNLMSVAADSNGNLIVGSYSSSSTLYTVNAQTGAVINSWNSGLDYEHGGDIQLESTVPEPSSFVLLGSALIAFGGYVRRKIND